MDNLEEKKESAPPGQAPKSRAKSTTKPAQAETKAEQSAETKDLTQPKREMPWRKYRSRQNGFIIKARIENEPFKCLRDGVFSDGLSGQANCIDELGNWAMEARSLEYLYEPIKE